MARFYFHIVNGDGRTVDEEGEEVPDLDAAGECAVRSVRSIISDEAKQGNIDLRGRIEVMSSEGIRVMVVPFADAVTIVIGAPISPGEQAGIVT